jgi:hypothetical protein
MAPGKYQRWVHCYLQFIFTKEHFSYLNWKLTVSQAHAYALFVSYLSWYSYHCWFFYNVYTSQHGNSMQYTYYSVGTTFLNFFAHDPSNYIWIFLLHWTVFSIWVFLLIKNCTYGIWIWKYFHNLLTLCSKLLAIYLRKSFHLMC